MSSDVPEGFVPDDADAPVPDDDFNAEPEKPTEEPKVVLECDQCDWQYLSDGSIPDEGLVEIMEEHVEREHS